MDSEKIKALLERYWNCETTLEEEQGLRDFFNGNDIPENLQQEAQLFRYLKQQQALNLHDLSFEHTLKQKIQPKESYKPYVQCPNCLKSIRLDTKIVKYR